jgi:hypothetical protein
VSNEQYLFVSYPLAGLVTLALAWVTFLYLRKSFVSTVDYFAPGHLAQILRRLFRPGLMMMALAGFLSVSYMHSCSGPSTYEGIVANRSLLVSRTYEQVAASFQYLIFALIGWAVLLAIVLCLARIRGGAPSR